MEPELKSFEAADSAFAQFVNSYALANADRETRRQYNRWRLDEGFRKMELKAERFEGKAEGIIEGVSSVAINLLKMNLPIEQIIAATSLTREEIAALSESVLRTATE